MVPTRHRRLIKRHKHRVWGGISPPQTRVWLTAFVKMKRHVETIEVLQNALSEEHIHLAEMLQHLIKFTLQTSAPLLAAIDIVFG